MSVEYRIFLENGFILDETIQENIIAAAKRGKITEKGTGLVLTPYVRKRNRRGGVLPDAGGFHELESVKKKDCIRLESLVMK